LPYPVNTSKLSDAILLLGKAFNNPSSKHVEQAIDLLQQSMREHKPLVAVPSSEVEEASANFIPMGVPWLDDWLAGGIRRQEVVLWGATPHAGKTHLLSWAGAQFLLEGRKVLHCNGEDILSDVRQNYILATNNHAEALSNLWFADMQEGRFGIREIEQLWIGLKTEGNEIDVIVIDHVDIMKNTAGKPDWEVVSDTMADLKLLAKRLDIIIMTATQLNPPSAGETSRGFARLYRAKVGKAANADIIIFVDDVTGNDYTLSREKARGRRKCGDKQKTVSCDWDTMQITDCGY
jgi:DnaB-like helicase C terminal domain